MDYETANATIKSHDWLIKYGSRPRECKNALEQAVWCRSAAQSRKTFTSDFHEVWLACAEELRRLADVHEYASMVDLHVNRRKSWDQVRTALGVSKTRQALAKRWDRFKADPPVE